MEHQYLSKKKNYQIFINCHYLSNIYHISIFFKYLSNINICQEAYLDQRLHLPLTLIRLQQHLAAYRPSRHLRGELYLYLYHLATRYNCICICIILPPESKSIWHLIAGNRRHLPPILLLPRLLQAGWLQVVNILSLFFIGQTFCLDLCEYVHFHLHLFAKLCGMIFVNTFTFIYRPDFAF